MTLRALAAFDISRAAAGIGFSIYLYDDGSSDGTADAVLQKFPETKVLTGDGSAYWCRSMSRLQEQAFRDGSDVVVWLNDDTNLYAHAIPELLTALVETDFLSIIVGAISWPNSGEVAYSGGVRRHPLLRPFRYQLVSPTGGLQRLDVMNGNCVAITREVASKVGALDSIYQHGMGDIDYALRANRLGVDVFLTPNFIGTCSRNPVAGTLHDHNTGWVDRLRFAVSRKGLPPKSWWALCRRHGGPLFIFQFLWSYLRVVISARP